MNKLQPGTKVLKSGYEGSIIREYMDGMYEVRLRSGVVVVPVSELTLV